MGQEGHSQPEGLRGANGSDSALGLQPPKPGVFAKCIIAGAVFIALAIFLVPKIGAATFIVLLITGQMFTSVAFDNFGWLGLAQRPVDLPRLIGAVLLIAGVVLIRR